MRKAGKIAGLLILSGILMWAALIVIALTVQSAAAEDTQFYTTSGVIEGKDGPVFYEAIHIGNSDQEATAHEAEAFTVYDNKQTRIPFTFQHNSRYRPVADSVVHNGVEAWNGLSPFSASVEGNTTRTARNCEGLAADGLSVIDWGRMPRPGIVAIACWYGPGECDIRIDPWAGLNDEWYRGIISHEVGHCAGLGHSDDPGALMYPYISVTTPQQDDYRGIWYLYGQRFWYWR